MRGFCRAGVSALAAWVVVLVSGGSLVACSAAPVEDSGKARRDRQEMQQRENKATQDLDRALDKAAPEQIDEEQAR